MNDPLRGKEAQVAKNKRFPLTCCWGRHLEGAWSCPKSLSTPSRTSNWRKMRANSGKSTATAVDLRAVVRRWVNFLHALDIIKTTDAVLSSIPCEALSALTPECVPHWRSRRTQVEVWIAFVFTGRWASAAAASVLSTVLYSASCRSLLWSDFITMISLRSKKMGTKPSPDDDEEVPQLSEAIIRRVKWSYKSLLERRGLKMLRFFEKFGKPPFPDLFTVNRSVNDVKRVCRGRIQAALPPTFKTHSSKTRRRIDFGLVAIF